MISKLVKLENQKNKLKWLQTKGNKKKFLKVLNKIELYIKRKGVQLMPEIRIFSNSKTKFRYYFHNSFLLLLLLHHLLLQDTSIIKEKRVQLVKNQFLLLNSKEKRAQLFIKSKHKMKRVLLSSKEKMLKICNKKWLYFWIIKKLICPKFIRKLRI